MTSTPTMRDSLTIALRGYVHHEPSHKSPRHEDRALEQPSEWTLIFDTETAVDETQHLRVGVYQVYRGDALDQAGLFIDSDSLTPAERTTVEAYAAKNSLQLKTRAEFVEDIFFLIGYDFRGVIVGFNLPFDISRLAISHSAARSRGYYGGYSFQLTTNRCRGPGFFGHDFGVNRRCLKKGFEHV